MNERATGDSRAERELRLHEIRREAEEAGRVGRAQGTARGEASAHSGYYGTPALKRPQWTVEVPIYFFVGGMAGAAALIAAVGQMSSADERLIRQSRWLAAIGGAISPALLVSDLGVPSRFLNMLRVFKIQSPMSVGSWTLVAFSNSAAATAVLGEFDRRRPGRSVGVLTKASQIVSALTGLALATYTGVLLGATAIPVWNQSVASLPVHFAASGTGAAAGMLELAGNKSKALNQLALGAALVETAMGAASELAPTPAMKALRKSSSGSTMRAAEILSGPLPLVLRLMSVANKRHSRNLRLAAALSSVAGSLVTRFAWVQAGKASAQDPSVPLELGE